MGSFVAFSNARNPSPKETIVNKRVLMIRLTPFKRRNPNPKFRLGSLILNNFYSVFTHRTRGCLGRSSRVFLSGYI